MTTNQNYSYSTGSNNSSDSISYTDSYSTGISIGRCDNITHANYDNGSSVSIGYSGNSNYDPCTTSVNLGGYNNNINCETTGMSEGYSTNNNCDNSFGQTSGVSLDASYTPSMGMVSSSYGTTSFNNLGSDSNCCSNEFCDNQMQNHYEVTNTSIAYVQILEDGIIMLSDSRNIRIENNIPLAFLDDSYQKIYYSASHKIGVVCTSYDQYENEKFVNICKDIDEKSYSATSFQNNLNKELQYYSKRTSSEFAICYAYFSDQYYYSRSHNAIPEIQAYMIRPCSIDSAFKTNGIGKKFVSGILWGVDFFKTLIGKESLSNAKNAAKSTQTILEKMIELSQVNQQNSAISGIGGKIQTLIIFEDGTTTTDFLSVN